MSDQNEDDGVCPYCGGSGEGPADGTTCGGCNGSGTAGCNRQADDFEPEEEDFE